MKPDPEHVEQFRQALDAIPKGTTRNAYAFGSTVAMIREAAETHSRTCVGCATCDQLRRLLAYVLAYELTSAPSEALRKIHGIDGEGL